MGLKPHLVEKDNDAPQDSESEEDLTLEQSSEFPAPALSRRFNLQYLVFLVLTILVVVGLGFSTVPIVTAPAPIVQHTPTSGVDNIVVNAGDTLYKLLAPYKVSSSDVSRIVAVAKPTAWDVSNLKAGTTLQIKHTTEKDIGKVMTGLLVNVDSRNKVEINRNEDRFLANSIKVNFVKNVVKVSGSIKSSIMGSALKAGVPLKNLAEAIKLYSHQVDFQRDIREGDKFTVLLEKFVSDDGETTYFGNTLFSSLDLRGNKYNIYRFKLSDGTEDFFDDQCRSVKRSLLRSPVMTTRISSGFGVRVHPISGYTHVHRGVDFAAPAGAPIYSAGNGIVTEIGYQGAYGKYIRIRHNNELSTAYAHARSFAKGLTKGSRVKQGQVIAYVGSSGNTTGAHLHFEVLMNGVQVNPLKIKSLPIRKLVGTEQSRFMKYKAAIDSALSSADNATLVASLSRYTS